MLSIFEALPVLGALLFRTGLTGLSSRRPLVASFVAAFGMDLLRQKVDFLERELARVQVRAIMEGEVGPGTRWDFVKISGEHRGVSLEIQPFWIVFGVTHRSRCRSGAAHPVVARRGGAWHVSIPPGRHHGVAA